MVFVGFLQRDKGSTWLFVGLGVQGRVLGLGACGIACRRTIFFTCATQTGWAAYALS